MWWDALGNYVSSLGFGSGDPEFARWWEQSRERVHLVGKGVLRFHAVYWPAMLLSAGLPLPTRVLVHDYLTVDGRKISKSLGGAAADPAELVRRYGTDAVRWWLLREVPRVGDADFTEERLIARADADLAGGFGNLVHRVVTMVHRYRGGVVPEAARVTTATAELGAVCARASGRVDAALDRFDYRGAVAAVWTLVEEANRCIDRTRPWELAKAGRDGELDAALAALVRACRELVKELAPSSRERRRGWRNCWPPIRRRADCPSPGRRSPAWARTSPNAACPQGSRRPRPAGPRRGGEWRRRVAGAFLGPLLVGGRERGEVRRLPLPDRLRGRCRRLAQHLRESGRLRDGVRRVGRSVRLQQHGGPSGRGQGAAGAGELGRAQAAVADRFGLGLLG
ncbi:class I tRNA ligase family protein [Streptacidiphilus monticola]